MGKYTARPKMFDEIQSKLEPLTWELFEKYVYRKLWKGGNWSGAQLAIWVFYSYDIRGFQYKELARFAEEARLEFFRNRFKHTGL